MKSKKNEVKLMIYSSLFTGLIIIGSYISIPTGIVPIVFANFFIFLASLILEKEWAFLSLFIYILLGAVGLPVFSGAVGGLHHIYGPTGGYLIGYIVAAYIIAFISGNKKTIFKDTIALLSGALAIHILGIFWLAVKFPEGWQNIYNIYWVFILGDLVKISLALYCIKYIRKYLANSIND